MSGFTGLEKEFLDHADSLPYGKIIPLLDGYLANGMDINATLDYDKDNFEENAGANLLQRLLIPNDYNCTAAEAVAFNRQLIDYFTAHGFDFSKCGWLFSARCLLNGMSSCVDFAEAEIAFHTGRYLLQKGAKSVAASCYDVVEEKWRDAYWAEETISELALGTAYEGFSDRGFDTANILYAYLLIIRLDRLRLPYEEIGLYPESYGKMINAVYSRGGEFFKPLPEDCCETGLNCGITKSLYFLLDDSTFLVCSINGTEEYAEREMQLFVDDRMPADAMPVSGKFAHFIGKSITTVNFKCKDKELSPIVSIVTDGGIIQIVS